MNPDNGDHGGFIGRVPPQLQVLREPTTSQQILGWFWSVVFAFMSIALFFVMLIAIGPPSIWVLGQVVILLAASHATRSIAEKEIVTEADQKFYRTLWIIVLGTALTASVGWFFFPLAEYWPPVPRIQQPWQLVLATPFIVIPMLFSALMSYSFLAGAVNPASYASYMARRAVGGLTDVFRPLDRPEMVEPVDPSMSREEIANLITEAVSKRPIIHRETLVKADRKRNATGLHRSPTPGSDESIAQDTDSAYVERDTREIDGKQVFHVVENGKPGMDVTVGAAEYYVRNAWPEKLGCGIKKWQENYGYSPNQIKVIRRMLEIYELIEPAKGQFRETITWLVSRDEAIEEFCYQFDLTSGQDDEPPDQEPAESAPAPEPVSQTE